MDNQVTQDQRTSEWFAARLGKITASSVSDLLVSGRGKDQEFGKTAIAYMYKKVAEILTGKCESISGVPLQWGIEHEEEAIEFYKELTGRDVVQVGFMIHPDHEMIGCSPDGLVGEGLIEVKCPYTSSTHTEALTNNTIPEKWKAKYYAQVQMQLWVTGAKWCDWVSYDPRMIDDNNKMVIVRYERDEEFIIKLEDKCIKAVAFIQDKIDNISKGEE